MTNCIFQELYQPKEILKNLFGILPWWEAHPDSKVHGANMGLILGRQDPGGPHVGPMNFAIWVDISCYKRLTEIDQQSVKYGSVLVS